MKKSRIIAAVLAVSMLPAWSVSARAAEWINLSSWAYQDVSAFVSKGLLPDSFKGISDYKQKITRLQFTDLAASVMKKTRPGYSSNRVSRHFEDTPAESSADFLSQSRIVGGTHEEEIPIEAIDGTTSIYYKYYFSPDNSITRQDAAVIIYNMIKYYNTVDTTEYAKAKPDYADAADIAEYAQEAAAVLGGLGIISGNDRREFAPQENLTIEQAVMLAYRMFNMLPKQIKSDFENCVDAKERVKLKSYSNGMEEYYADNTIYICENGKDLLTLESDIYSIVHCADHDGKRLAYCVNFNDTTDVFDPDTGALLYTIPYIVESVDESRKYLYIVSYRYSPMLYGLYGMDGKELAKPEYSKPELEQLIANNFKEPEQPYAAPEGWIYYADWTDTGHMYKVDSNGDNRQKLSDYDCYDIQYFAGRIFYRTRQDDQLHCMKEDGSCDQVIGAGKDMELWENYDDAGFFCPELQYQGIYAEYSHYVRVGGKYLLMYENGAEENPHRHLYRVNLEDDILVPERIGTDEWVVSYFDTTQYAYFQVNEGAPDWKEKKGFYRTDGETIEEFAADYKIARFGFYVKDENSEPDYTKIAFTTGNNEGKYYLVDLSTGEITEHECPIFPPPQEYVPPTGLDSSVAWEFSDDRFTVTEYYDFDNDYGYFTAEHDGKVSDKIEYTNIWGRIGSCLTYYNDRGVLRLYNMETGEDTLIRSDFRNYDYFGASTRPDFSDTAFYDDWNNVHYKYTLADGEQVVYPCKGLDKYGKIADLKKPDSDNRLFKLTADGNYYPLTGPGTMFAIFVRNGAEMKETFQPNLTEYFARIAGRNVE